MQRNQCCAFLSEQQNAGSVPIETVNQLQEFPVGMLLGNGAATVGAFVPTTASLGLVSKNRSKFARTMSVCVGASL